MITTCDVCGRLFDDGFGFLSPARQPTCSSCHPPERVFTVMMSLKEEPLLRRDPSLYFRRSVPWAMVAPHEAQARTNHGGQTLQRLFERGGLSPFELVCVLTDTHFDVLLPDVNAYDWRAKLEDLVREWERT